MKLDLLLLALSGGAALKELYIVNCTEPSTRGWKVSGKALTNGGLCATALEPIGNGGMAILDKCITGGNIAQLWSLNSTFFPATPNASTAIVLPGQANSNAVFGWTFPSGASGPNTNAKVAFYDIGARFHGECTGHHNCNFNLNTKTGQISTYWGDKCIGAIDPPPPSTPAPTPPTPTYKGTIGFADACGDHMVLQQQPAKAAVYGPVGNVQSGQKPVVEVTVIGGSTSYTVPASIVETPSVTAFAPTTAYAVSWKAFLKPTQAGGTFTVIAKCTAGCVGSANISDVTFGDVWCVHGCTV
jgi:hypothetical protein